MNPNGRGCVVRHRLLFIGVLALCYVGMAWGIRHLVRLRERLVLALKSGGAGSFDLDLRTGTAVWSEETFRIFGLAPLQDRSGYETWKAVLHPEDRERVIRERQAAIEARDAEHHMEYRVVHPDGTVRWVETVGRTISNPDGTPVRVSGLHIDITRRKEAEAALQAAKNEAERANLAKTKFLAAASHDLRQPMQSMFMFAAALHPHVTSERGRNALTMLERGLDTMKGLLDTLLDVSRLDAGVIRPAIEDFPIRPVLDHIGASYQPVAAAKGLELRVGATCDTVVRSDPNLLGRMVRNLVENAIRYTEFGYVRLTCHVVNGHARIAVHDTGIGIPPAHLERVFDEFHQLGNPERDRSQGLGLGLSIVQRLSRLLGHPVTVESEPGQGSVFSIDVTLGKAPALLDNQPGAIVPRDGEGRLAVLVDDDAIVLLGLRAIFQDWKFQTLIAASAEQAVERLKSDGRIPDIIIADYRLRGGERGTDAVQRIRDLLGVAVPAIILTGETGMEWQREAGDLGYGIAFKPVTPRQLHDVLRRHLGDAA
jgi:PAS domain S-box-containing protein